MTLSDVLVQGFSAAHRRPGSIVLDLVWKGIWLGITGAGLLFIIGWIGSILRQIEMSGQLSGALSTPVGLAILGRQLWNAYASRVFWIVTILLVISDIAWILLESYFRAGLLTVSAESFRQKAAAHFRLFFASTLVKIFVNTAFITIGLLIVFGRYLSFPVAEWRDLWAETRAPLAMLIGIVVAVWFVLTVFETLVRSESMDLLATNLFQVIGVVAVLVTFEGLIVLSFAIIGVAVVMTVSGMAAIVALLAAAASASVVLTILHSYLLIVRFSSIGIMKHVTDL